MKAAGLPTAVVTASANGEQVVAVGGFADLIDARVDGVVAAREGLRGKPAPDTFLAGARALGVRARAGGRLRGRAGRGGRRPGRGSSGTSWAWTASGRPTRWPPHGADVVVTDLAELLGTDATAMTERAGPPSRSSRGR